MNTNETTHTLKKDVRCYVFTVMTATADMIFVELKSTAVVPAQERIAVMCNHTQAFEYFTFNPNGKFQAVSLAAARTIWRMLSEKGWIHK